MKLFFKGKDGGPESTVTGYWLIEWKRLFSVALLKFEGDSREAYHTHAFNAVSWLLKGELYEDIRHSEYLGQIINYTPSITPIFTPRERFHKVNASNPAWVLTFRGPWSETWCDYDEKTKKLSTLTTGRKVVSVGHAVNR